MIYSHANHYGVVAAGYSENNSTVTEFYCHNCYRQIAYYRRPNLELGSGIINASEDILLCNGKCKLQYMLKKLGGGGKKIG